MISENIITTEKTSKYYTLGKLTNKTITIWIVFHGYGQLAKYFLKSLELIKNDSNFIIAPEALNKFYLNNFQGRVGSSWMTKENREHEIKDYVKMINIVFNSATDNFDLANVKINVLGFSQGTHTAVRWINNSKHLVNNLILWSGTFPHDINYINNELLWNNLKTKIVIGKKDTLINKGMIDTEINYMKENNLKAKFIFYDNNHDIEKSTLKSVINSIDL